MVSKLICKLIILFILYGSLSGQTGEITYIANEGFLINTGQHKILIDGIFNDTTIYFADVPSEEMLDKMKKALPPFDKVDLLLITHNHRDHFASEPVAEFLSSSPGTIVVCNQQTSDKFKKESDIYPHIKEQIRIMSPGINAIEKYSENGIEVEIIGLNHSHYFDTDENGTRKDRHAGIKVNGYYVKADGISFLHIGDSTFPQHKDFYINYQLYKRNPSVVFAHGFGRDAREIVLEHMKPMFIIPMHLPAEKEKVLYLMNSIPRDILNIVILTEPLEKHPVILN